jgi:hypothetical protein
MNALHNLVLEPRRDLTRLLAHESCVQPAPATASTYAHFNLLVPACACMLRQYLPQHSRFVARVESTTAISRHGCPQLPSAAGCNPSESPPDLFILCEQSSTYIAVLAALRMLQQATASMPSSRTGSRFARSLRPLESGLPSFDAVPARRLLPVSSYCPSRSFFLCLRLPSVQSKTYWSEPIPSRELTPPASGRSRQNPHINGRELAPIVVLRADTRMIHGAIALATVGRPYPAAALP